MVDLWCRYIHVRAKESEDNFRVLLDVVGIHRDGVESLLLGNCRICGTTLAMPIEERA